MRFQRALPFLLLLVAALPARGTAQVTGLPVRNSGISSGLTIAGEVGFPRRRLREGNCLRRPRGGRIRPHRRERRHLELESEGSGPTQTGLGGYLNLKVFGGPLVPFSVTLQGGAEYVKNSGARVIHAPIGLGIALRIPNPALAIKPWIAPRLDVVRVSGIGDHQPRPTRTSASAAA